MTAPFRQGRKMPEQVTRAVGVDIGGTMLQIVGTLLGSDSGVIGAALLTTRDHRR